MKEGIQNPIDTVLTYTYLDERQLSPGTGVCIGGSFPVLLVVGEDEIACEKSGRWNSWSTEGQWDEETEAIAVKEGG